jgi:type I restriction enzyme, S subunit
MSVKDFKPGWKHVKFGDIVENVSVRVNPADAKTDVYVGFEHLDPETLHLRRWGHPSDVTGQKLAFKKGDVIFGRRRAYQRKLAVAEFDGICSAHALVVRAKPKMILPEFLPFFLQSDMFMERAIEISVGSLSPTINWKTLRVQGFPLPPLEEQKRIAEIFWAADEAYSQQNKSLGNLMSAKLTLMNRLTTKGVREAKTHHTRIGRIADNWDVMTIEDITSLCQYGLSIPLHESGQYPILRMMNFDDGRIIANELKYVDLNDSVFSTFKLQKGDILFNRTNSADLVGKVGIFELEGNFVFASYLVRLRANERKVLPDYLNFYLNSELGQRRLLAYATPGVSQTNISAGNLKKVLVPIPPLEEQQGIVSRLKKVESIKALFRQHIQNSKTFLSALINNLIVRGEDREVTDV